MARISTGETYGDTNRTTAAQLLGGIPTDSTSGAIAQGAITAPSLQPRATPVQTFQQVGAPVLGGAPKFFAPPDLPNPGQDMANLAKALGGFSTTLQSFGEAYTTKLQVDSKEAEQNATGLVTKYGPAYDLAQITSAIEKKVTLGGPDAPQAAKDLSLLREMQHSSIGRVWLQRSSEQNAISESAVTLADRLTSITTIDDNGKKVDFSSLPTNDPRYKAARDKAFWGDKPLSPAVLAKNQALILNVFAQADEAHRKRYNTAQEILYTGQAANNRKVYAEEFVTNPNRLSDGDLIIATAKKYQREIDGWRAAGLTQEAQRRLTEKVVENFTDDVLLAAKAKEMYIDGSRLAPFLKGVFRLLQTGPVDQRQNPDGTLKKSLLIYNQLGGEPYLDQVLSKASAKRIQDESQRSQFATIQAGQQYNDARELARKNGTLGTAFFETQQKIALAIPDPYLRNARLSAINADQTQFDATYTAPAQALKALHFTQQLATTMNNDAGRKKLSAEIEQALINKQITGSAAITLQGSIAAQGNRDVRSYDGAINKRMSEIRKREAAYQVSENSYGGPTPTSYEQSMMTNFETRGFQGAQDAVAKAIAAGKDPVDAINKYFDTHNFGFTRRTDPAPSDQSLPQLIQQNTGSASRNIIDPLKANNLRGAAQNKQVLEQGAFMGEMDTWLRTGKPSEGFKTLMKALMGGGKKASDVILNQYRLHGISPDPAALEKIKALDGQRLSMAPPQPRMTPQQNPALMGISMVSRAIGDLLAPPASAMEMPTLPPLPSFGAKPPTAPPPVTTSRTTSAGKAGPGLVVPGNIDLAKRPKVKNADGSISTVRSMEVGADGLTYLIPTVVGNRVVSKDEAINHWHATGQHLGAYKTLKQAKAAGEQLHLDQAAFYGLKPKPVVGPSARVDGYLKRLSYIETRLRNIPNTKGSGAMGYFQAQDAFNREATQASGGKSPRSADFKEAKDATAAWIRVNNKKAWVAINAGRYDEADRLLRGTWPSLPGGTQAQEESVQRKGRTYLR